MKEAGNAAVRFSKITYWKEVKSMPQCPMCGTIYVPAWQAARDEKRKGMSIEYVQKMLRLLEVDVPRESIIEAVQVLYDTECLHARRGNLPPEKRAPTAAQ